MEKQLTKKRNWEELVLEEDTTFSHELLQTYEEGNIEELGIALKMYYKNSITSAELDLHRYLRYLMEKIMQLIFSDEFKTQKQWEAICNLQSEIEDHLEYNDCLNNDSIKKEWKVAFEDAKDLASIYAPKAKNLEKLTWYEVFEKSYHPDNYGK